MTIQRLNLLLVFVCCTMIKTRAQQITVEAGTALNAKPSAVVVSKTKGMYYLKDCIVGIKILWQKS